VNSIPDVDRAVAPSIPSPAGHPAPRPRFRGRIHQVAFIVSIPACLLLVAVGSTLSARVATAVYGIALTGLLGTSASYHRYPWSPVAMARMQRLDHSMIFLLIAGTYTPFAILALHGVLQAVVLAVVWTGAAVGIGLKQLQRRGLPAVTAVLYVALGWVAVVAIPQFVTGVSAAASALLFAGGLLYTAGAVVLARRRPDPIPDVFGYHEIWHGMVTAAILCHYLAILILLLTVP
jgi:hemolysin III